MRKFLCKGIHYDFTGCDDDDEDVVAGWDTNPDELIIEADDEDCDFYDFDDPYERDEYLANKISDKTGWCIFGIEEVEEIED